MEILPDMVDLAFTPPDVNNMPEATNIHLVPQYPYGLNLCLNDEVLNKLNLDNDCEVGDHVQFHCLARVTSCAEHEGSGRRVELQIVAMSAESDEDDENEEAEEESGHKLGRFNPY